MEDGFTLVASFDWARVGPGSYWATFASYPSVAEALASVAEALASFVKASSVTASAMASATAFARASAEASNTSAPTRVINSSLQLIAMLAMLSKLPGILFLAFLLLS